MSKTLQISRAKNAGPDEVTLPIIGYWIILEPGNYQSCLSFNKEQSAPSNGWKINSLSAGNSIMIPPAWGNILPRHNMLIKYWPLILYINSVYSIVILPIFCSKNTFYSHQKPIIKRKRYKNFRKESIHPCLWCL